MGAGSPLNPLLMRLAYDLDATGTRIKGLSVETMTSARRQRKSSCGPLVRHVWPAAALMIAATWLAVPAMALTEGVVIDRHTGLAIYGFDPVAYFTEGTPTFGRPEIEHTAGGVTWRFRNIGNRDAFVHRPDVYMPRFGGYDPLAIGRGVALAGNPILWFITGARLYLFYDRASLDAFSADPDQAIVAAERRWPEVQQKLVH